LLARADEANENLLQCGVAFWHFASNEPRA
jgi:hypothetical protein